MMLLGGGIEVCFQAIKVFLGDRIEFVVVAAAAVKAQAEKSRELLEAHAAGTFAKPGAGCQVLMNGDLRLVPNG